MRELTLLGFFLGVALCFPRAPRADRWHVALVFIAGAIWGMMAAAMPEVRTRPYAFAAGSFFILGFFQLVRRRQRLPR